MGSPPDMATPIGSAQSAMRFEEVQHFRQWWLLLFIAAASAAVWYCFIVQIGFGKPVGSKPAPDALLWVITAIVGVGVPILFGILSMRTRVDDHELSIRFRPFVHRRIPLTDIDRADAVTYHPVLDYGGWGVRLGFKGWCYNVSGNRGVMLALTNGKRVMVGSRRPEELAASIARHRPVAIPA